MKNKIIGIITCFALLVTSFAATIFVRQEPVRFHQHLMAAKKPACTNHGSDKFCTHLPVLKIETDEDIPGQVTRDENGERAFTTAKDGSDTIKSTIKVIDNPESNNHTDDKPAIQSDALIHVHGHSSRYFAKLGYRIKLIDSNGDSNNQSVMGMDAHSEWILHGPYLDKTLIRNYMWYNIGGEIMSYSPNVRFCEMFLNGEYEGIYVVTENITAGKGGARLDLSVDKKDNTFSGYLLRLDRKMDDDINNFTKYALRLSDIFGINIEYPGTKNITPEMATSITKDFSAFEKSIYSYDFDSDEFGFKKTIDIDSFVDYFIINEFTCNYDAGAFSTYIYKDSDGKFRMCIWDFNNSCDNYQEQAMQTNDFRLINVPWYWMLTKNKDFTKRIVDRYRELRKTYLSDEYINNYIDSTLDYLGDAVDRNFKRWSASFKDEGLLTPPERNIHNFKDAVTQLKGFLEERSSFMDTNIDVIAQYSAESRVKKFIENAN